VVSTWTVGSKPRTPTATRERHVTPVLGTQTPVSSPQPSALRTQHSALDTQSPAVAAPRILLVDDDRDLVDLVGFALDRAGFKTSGVFDGPTALEAIHREQPDLIVLDLHLGGESGFDILQKVRAYSDVPVLMLTCEDREDQMVYAFGLGVDDYVTKPFSHRVLAARITALLNRKGVAGPAPRSEPAVLRVGPITLSIAQHTVTIDGQRVDLSVTEFRFLALLMSQADNVLPSATILEHIWGSPDAGAGDLIRTTLHRLRRKLGDNPASPRLLHTVPGVGIMLSAE
jgi:DNA-binding response OmpR family regulator